MQLSISNVEAGRSLARGRGLARGSHHEGLVKNIGGLCLSTEDRNANGGKVVMGLCDYTNLNEQWSFDAATGRIKSVHGICLDASQRSVDGGKVHMWSCEDNNPNQVWTYDAASGRIRNRGGICLDTPWRRDKGSEVHMWQCIDAEANQHWTFVAPPSTSCRTARPSEDCYKAIEWALNIGIRSHPDWYPGLSSSSTYEDFQAFLHTTNANGRVCPDSPCKAATTTAPPTTAISAACAAVMQTVAQDAWSSGTCSSRIEHYRSSQGGSKPLQDALAQAALDYPSCAACWPWKKYKVAGDTRLSEKRGIAIQNKMLTEASLTSLATVVSWGKIWEFAPGYEGGPNLAAWARWGVRFVPTVWGTKTLLAAEATGLPQGEIALLGFNEPNVANQANLSPQQAAQLWPRLEQLAKSAGIRTMVSPAVAFSQSNDPVRWLQDFLAACSSCQVDAVAFHTYTCYGRWLKEHIDKFRIFGKPMWITEFACSDPQAPERLSAEGQMAYMREAVPLLEHDPDVQMYAWFSYFKDQWAFPIVAGENGDAGLVHPDGSLTALGKLYASFSTTRPTENSRSSPAVDGVAAHFLPIDGGLGRVCRGANSRDNSASYYQVYLNTASLDACKARCMKLSSCKGVEYSPSTKRCEAWTRPSGIGATRAASGYTCLRYQASCHTAVDGEACFAAVSWAKESGVHVHPEWYPGLGAASSFEDFQAHLHRTGAANGVCTEPPC